MERSHAFQAVTLANEWKMDPRLGATFQFNWPSKYSQTQPRWVVVEKHKKAKLPFTLEFHKDKEKHIRVRQAQEWRAFSKFYTCLAFLHAAQEQRTASPAVRPGCTRSKKSSNVFQQRRIRQSCMFEWPRIQ